jgi:hypothetical protein
LDAEKYDGQSNAVDAARRLAGLASNNAEASVERLHSEPGNGPLTLEAAMTIVTSVRRRTGAISVIWLLPRTLASWQATREFGALLGWIGESLEAAANAANSNVAPAPLKKRPDFAPAVITYEDHDAGALLAAQIARICAQIESMHAALAHLALPSPVEM